MDETISEFAAITGAEPKVARHYLSMTDGNVEQAIQLYFDSPELASTMETTSPTPAPPVASSVPTGRTAAGAINLDSDDDMPVEEFHEVGEPTVQAPASSRPAPTAAFEDDEAMARRMQEEYYGGAGAGGGEGVPGYDGESVRAPMARTTETLVGPSAGFYPGDDMRDSVLQQIRAREAARGNRTGVFNQRPTGRASIWDETGPRSGLGEGLPGIGSEAQAKQARLAELFRPPFDLMSRITLDDAREQGKEDQKWIIVNVQDPSIFDCQALNRDIWKHDGIKETVKENFIFLQYSKDDPAGQQYINYYFPQRESQAAYPHIAIMDPRTGEQVKIWEGAPIPKAMDFLMQLHEFLDRYSLDVSIRNPVARRKVEKPVALDVGRLTEQEMLDLALKNSLANGSAPEPKREDPDDLTKSIGDLGKGKGKEKEIDEGVDVVEEVVEVADGGAESAFSHIASDQHHVEPENDPATTTRIQFRHSSGRVIRRFSVSDPVLRIYQWLKSDPIDGKVGIPFELKAMGKDLIESLDESIGDAGLKNGTVMVEFLED